MRVYVPTFGEKREAMMYFNDDDSTRSRRQWTYWLEFEQYKGKIL